MPKSKTEILINTDIERCWKFILDLKNIGLRYFRRSKGP
jgi:hypothetical protein